MHYIGAGITSLSQFFNKSQTIFEYLTISMNFWQYTGMSSPRKYTNRYQVPIPSIGIFMKKIGMYRFGMGNICDIGISISIRVVWGILGILISVWYRFFNAISVSYISISVSYRYICVIPIYHCHTDILVSYLYRCHTAILVSVLVRYRGFWEYRYWFEYSPNRYWYIGIGISESVELYQGGSPR